MEVRINTNPEIEAFVRTLDDVGRKQVPYAASRAINEALLFARGQVRRELPEHFKIRSNWVAKGIQVRLSNKRALTGMIFTKDDFMARQEAGGDKPRSGKEQAIPFAIRGEDGQQKTLKSRWPSQMIGKDRAFMVRSETSRVGLVLRRNGRGKRKNQVLYVLLGKTVKVKARWNFRKRVEEIANQVFPMTFKAELAAAIASRKE
jgi:hypothetical protein